MIKALCSFGVSLMLVGCSYTEPARVWSDIHYPAMSVAVQVVNTAGLNKEDENDVREALTQALGERHIEIDSSAALKLRLEVLKYRMHPAGLWALQWMGEGIGMATLAHWSRNKVEVRASIILPDGQTIEIDKLSEIRESGRSFWHLLRSTMRRVADAVFYAES